MICPFCINTILDCTECRGARTLIQRTHLEIFEIYCRAALSAQIVLDKTVSADYTLVGRGLGLTTQQVAKAYTKFHCRAEQLRRALNVPNAEHRALSGQRIVADIDGKATIVTI